MSATVRRGVAIYEILIGLIAFVSAAISRTEISWLQLMLAIIGGAVSVAAGVLLWRDKPVARRLSFIVQALQVPQVSISGIVEYGIALGATVTPSIGFIPQSFQHSIHSSLRFGSQVSGLYVGINVLALIALVLVARWKHENSRKSNHVVATA
ncbi:MAG TPA: hypothetical protein VIM21_06300 [Gemmatimonadaceae bacterium]